jgi:hypothetical protein
MQQLQQDLDSIRAEQGKLPALVQEVHEALQAEVEAFERQEAGASFHEPALEWLAFQGTSPCLSVACVYMCVNVYMRRARYPRVPGPAALRPAHKVLPSFRPAALCNQEGLKERKLGALHQALGMYQQRLGLEFQHGDTDGEQLRVVMTQVDARDPARPFTVAVQVMGDNSYAGE